MNRAKIIASKLNPIYREGTRYISLIKRSADIEKKRVYCLQLASIFKKAILVAGQQGFSRTDEFIKVIEEQVIPSIKITNNIEPWQTYLINNFTDLFGTIL